MNKMLKIVAGGLAAAALAIVGTTAIADTGTADSSDSGEGPDVAITGDALDRASQVALDHLGGGTVTETEIEDEESYYEVEVTRDDGSQVDVQLDEGFNVVGGEDDGSERDD